MRKAPISPISFKTLQSNSFEKKTFDKQNKCLLSVIIFFIRVKYIVPCQRLNKKLIQIERFFARFFLNLLVRLTTEVEKYHRLVYKYDPMCHM